MRILCTYCSAGKDPDEGLIPAFKRYVSPRIDQVRRIAELEGAHFCILSGKFGLVDWDQPLEFYDHLLRNEEVPKLTEEVVRQLREKNTTQVDYYTQRPDINNNAKLYMDAMEKASKNAGVKLRVIFVEPIPANGDWKHIMEVAAQAGQILIHDRIQGEHEFNKALRLFPEDGMIFYQRARGYEAINQYGLAKDDYERAKRLFPLDRWRRQAQEGWDRCEEELAKGGTISESCLRVKSFSRLDPFLKQELLRALNKVNNEPSDAAKELRRILEVLVSSIMEDHRSPLITGKMRSKLSENIKALKDNSVVPEIIAEHMYTINKVGNIVVHRKSTESPINASDAYPSVTALVAILEWLNAHEK